MSDALEIQDLYILAINSYAQNSFQQFMQVYTLFFCFIVEQ